MTRTILIISGVLLALPLSILLVAFAIAPILDRIYPPPAVTRTAVEFTQDAIAISSLSRT